VVVANLNGPRQTVVSGPRDAVVRVVDHARSQGLRVFDLPVACAFHSKAVAAASDPLTRTARGLMTAPPDRPVFANLDAAPHPADPSAIAERLGAHVASPVRFAEMIAAMHGSGSRVFVEVGPGSVLAPMVGSILGDRPHMAVSCDAPGRLGVPALLQALARLCVAGVGVDPMRLTADRDARPVDLDHLPSGDGSPPLPASAWLVNGSRARPLAGPEPRRLGQAVDRPHPSGRNGHHAAIPNGTHGSKTTIVMKDVQVPRTNGIHHLPPGESAPGRNGHTSQTSLSPAPADPGAARVMEAFQETMRAFLETQRATMLAYLGRCETATGVGNGREINGHEPPLQRPPAPHVPAKDDHSPSNGVANDSVATGDLLANRRNGDPDPRPGRVVDPESPRDEAAAPGVARASVADRLVAIVRERTGYPAEMLKPGLDLEADLGIDSIKRIEILGTLRESVDGLEGVSDSSVMDGLARARTLGEIVERVEAVLESRTSAPSKKENDAGPPVQTQPPSPVRRLVLDRTAAPLSDDRTGLRPGGTVVITDDCRGVARALGGLFREEGHPVEILGRGRVDLTSPSSVEAILTEVREAGPIAGIVHALPLGDAKPISLVAGAWSDRVGGELRGLFLLARAAGADLDAASRSGGACLVAATAMGGAFATSRVLPGPFFPGQGGVAGLVKTLAREWPEVRVRVVDLCPREPAEGLAARLAAEALTDDGWPEVGYRRGRRIRLRAVPSPLEKHGAGLILSPGDPVLVTGGARGITAAVAAELARRWRPTLLLVGSGAMPPVAEDPATAGRVHAAELKATLHGRLRRAGRDVGPAELEAAYRSLLNQRQVREGLRAIRAAGSAVEYARADVRDAEALARALDEWRTRFGHPVGLIHGAGVIHDKLLRDKTPESFDRVLGTKLDGALNLARLLKPEALRFTAFFSSIAGRFGNEGQSDYAAANDALNKVAVWLDRRWPGRVMSINWGPWAGLGMVSELEGHLGRRGLGMIPPDVGAAAFADELQFGRKGEVEILVAGALGPLADPLRRSRRPAGAIR
jgi:NAD(P)-dependent dehydrogenase (short-subunit alcohol dehydrogenase family)